MPKYNIWILYQQMSTLSKKKVKERYQSYFDVTERAFYKALKSDKLSAQQLDFFAARFKCPVSELIGQDESIQEPAQELGLNK